MPRRAQATPAKPSATPSGTWWRISVILLAGFLVYSNSLSGPFVFDDNDAIVNNAALRDWTNPGQLFAAHAVDTPLAGRPIVDLSFALNFAAGGLAVQGYHLGNIAIQLHCA